LYQVENCWFEVLPDLGVRIPGCTVPLASDSSAHLDLRLSVWMFTVGRMVLLFFLGSHDTLVVASEQFMMSLWTRTFIDSDIPMNVPFTLLNKQPLTPSVPGLGPLHSGPCFDLRRQRTQHERTLHVGTPLACTLCMHTGQIQETGFSAHCSRAGATPAIRPRQVHMAWDREA
jgi:hypothetical protein